MSTTTVVPRPPTPSKKTLSPQDETALVFLQGLNEASDEDIALARSVLLQYKLTLTHNIHPPDVQAYLDDV